MCHRRKVDPRSSLVPSRDLSLPPSFTSPRHTLKLLSRPRSNTLGGDPGRKKNLPASFRLFGYKSDPFPTKRQFGLLAGINVASSARARHPR